MPYKDPNKAKEYLKQYQETHKEEIKTKRRIYLEQNKERIAKTKKKYYESHKKEQKSYAERYKSKHPEKIKQYRQNHRKEKNEKFMHDNDMSRLHATSHRNLWTPDEIVILQKMLSQGCTYKEIAYRLGRTLAAVNGRITLLRKNGDSFNGNPVDI